MDCRTGRRELAAETAAFRLEAVPKSVLAAGAASWNPAGRAAVDSCCLVHRVYCLITCVHCAVRNNSLWSVVMMINHSLMNVSIQLTLVYSLTCIPDGSQLLLFCKSVAISSPYSMICMDCHADPMRQEKLHKAACMHSACTCNI